MEAILNYTPQVYEAIIAALVIVGLIQAGALRRKWHQAEKLKSVLKTVIIEATKAVVTGAMFGAVQVAKAKAETRKIALAADSMAKAAEGAINELQNRVDELEAESADSRIDDLEQRLDDLENTPSGVGEETSGVHSSPRFPFDIETRGGPFGDLPFGSFGLKFNPLPDRGSGVDRRLDPLSELFASLESGPGGGQGGRGPSIKAFRITPRGLEPVNGPEDFLGGGTFNRPTPGDRRQPSLATILSLLASLPTPPRRPSESPDSFKADLASGPGAFLYDEHGPAAPGDAYADLAKDARASLPDAGLGDPHPAVEAEACGTQRPADAPEPQTAAPEPQTAAPLAGGDAESPGNDPGARAGNNDRRVPRYGRNSGGSDQSPRAG